MPLASLAPGLDGSVLTVLAGAETAMSATQIQRIGGRGSRYGLVLALERLVAQGIVTATPAGRGNLYQLNRQHVLAPVVTAATQVRAEVDRRVGEALDAFVPKPLGAAVYGSVARGEATASSDIDLLIIAADSVDPDEENWVNQIDALERQARDWTGNPLHCVTVTASQLKSMIASSELIVNEWQRDARTTTGRDVRQMILAARKRRQA